MENFIGNGGEREFVIFGAGEYGKLVYKFLKKIKKNVVAFCDNDTDKQGGRIEAVEIMSLESIEMKYPNSYIIVSTINYGEQIRRQLLEAGISEDRFYVICIYDIFDMRRWLPEEYVSEDESFIYYSPIDLVEEVQARERKKCYQEVIDVYQGEKWIDKAYRVSICGIFKNEAPYIKEWIEFHRLVGVDHFYLYNNNSTDNYMDVLTPYIKNGYVTLIEWPYAHEQIKAYVHCMENFRNESNWIGFIDLDEFVVPIDNKSIGDFLAGFKQRGSVVIHWKMFGSGGIIERDISGLVTNTFHACWDKHCDVGKCFYNTAFEYAKGKINKVSHHILWTEQNGKEMPPVNFCNKATLRQMTCEAAEHFPIQINHYAIKSFAEYQNKILGTSVNREKNPHTENAFRYVNAKCNSEDKNIDKYMDKLMWAMKRGENVNRENC